MLQSIKIGKSELKRVDFTSMDNKKSVVFSDQHLNGFRMTASPQGLNIMGITITSHKDLEKFAQLVAAMWAEAENLKPRIVTDPKAAPDPAV